MDSLDEDSVGQGSANVYEDLGLPDSAEMQVKAILVHSLAETLET